ncbi:uncharacterized protein LOC110919584 [Helianthus annuus]|uniref:uncharacterized protein LOC110919584 n=1 Tax=Helianthus annuus TaxID=4232 RepID=UPI000B8FBC86|nr:uncharacterized protein LOC110919584 [Helianthus annuus]
MKRKGRESLGASILKEHLTQSSMNQQRALEILESNSSKLSQSTKFSIEAAMGLLSRMVDAGLIREDKELWLFAMDLFEDSVKREMFINVSHDHGGDILYTLALGLSNRDVGERFQRSGETISRAFHEILEAIAGRGKGFQGLARDVIKPKDPTFQFIPPQILNDKRYMSYFKDCIGCIDGTHIGACIPESQQLPYIGRKGVPTFNIGWEGSAHDMRVFINATQNSKFNFPQPPEGRYYLVDKGYPDRKGYLVPYSKTRYHQSQFQREPPNNMQEAFNRSHSSLRSHIERSFGILKKRFKILGKMPKYSVQTQIDVIMATFALHNYIRNSQEDFMFIAMEQHPNYILQDELHDVRNHDTSTGLFEGTSNEMKYVRNEIATLIWNA